MPQTIYKVTTTYRTAQGTFTEQHIGTLLDCIRAAQSHGRGHNVLEISGVYEPLILNVTDKFISIFKDN